MARNASKKRKVSKSRGFIPELLIFFGVLLVTFSSLHNIIRLRSLRLDRQTVETYQAINQPLKKRVIPTHIIIKWFVDVEIEPQVYKNGNWTISSDKASYLLDSAEPGTMGNLILYGHNKRTILGNIRALTGKELIELTLSNGERKIYKIESLKEVDPKDTQLLRPTTDEVLTIYTCSGIFDSRRFVIKAIPE